MLPTTAEIKAAVVKLKKGKLHDLMRLNQHYSPLRMILDILPKGLDYNEPLIANERSDHAGGNYVSIPTGALIIQSFKTQKQTTYGPLVEVLSCCESWALPSSGFHKATCLWGAMEVP